MKRKALVLRAVRAALIILEGTYWLTLSKKRGAITTTTTEFVECIERLNMIVSRIENGEPL